MTSTAAPRAFIGSFTSSGGRGIVQATVDPDTGSLTPTAVVDTVPDPSYLALGRRPGGGPVLYCVSERTEGAVAAFDVAGPAPVPLGAPVPVEGADPTHLAVVAGHVVTANYGSGSVTALPLGADGVPGKPGRVLGNEGSGPDPERQEGPHAHQVVPDPSGRWVLSVDLGTDAVRVCELDAATGGLRLHASVPLPPGTGPRHLVLHPRGTHAYVLGELRPVVTVCRWDGASGELRPVAEFPLFPDGSDVHVQPSAPVISLDGRRLWAAVRGTDTVVVLSVDEDGERLEVLTSVPCGGTWPRDLVLDPSGRRLYAANERSGDVTWFDLDEDGVPRRAGAVDVPAASSVLFVRP